MLLITKHEIIAQKYRFFIFSVLNYTKSSKHTFDFFCLVIKCIARGIKYASFMKIYGAYLFPWSKEALFTLIVTQHLIRSKFIKITKSCKMV